MLHAHWGLARLAQESLGTQDDGDKTRTPGSPHSGRGHGEAPRVTSASFAEARAKPWLHLTGGGEEQSDLTSRRQGAEILGPQPTASHTSGKLALMAGSP